MVAEPGADFLDAAADIGGVGKAAAGEIDFGAFQSRLRRLNLCGGLLDGKK